MKLVRTVVRCSDVSLGIFSCFGRQILIMQCLHFVKYEVILLFHIYATLNL
jgi:hypothetical protein